MTDREKIKAEIRRMKNLVIDENGFFDSSYIMGTRESLSALDRFIDNLPEEPASAANEDDNIGWERRRFEMAKAVYPFAAKLTTDILSTGGKIEDADGKTVAQVCAEKTMFFTNAMMEELKKK